MSVIELTKQLVSIPSTSGLEADVGQVILERLRKNFDVSTQSVGDRFNIFAYRGKPNVILTTHMDTVPGNPPVREDEESIYGRGSCDAKGILASMICACEEAAEKGLNNFGMVFDVSEETDFSGILEAHSQVTPKYAIVGEPTDFKIVYGQKGLIQLKITSQGKSAPGSMPQEGISAINNLVDLLGAFKGLTFPHNEHLGATTINIGQISGGSAPNMVADYAEGTIEIRSTEPNNQVLDVVRSVIPEDNLEIVYAYERALNDDVSYLDSFDFERMTVPYFTEMYWWMQKSKSFIFGPGLYEHAHTEGEQIRKADLLRAQDVYVQMIEKLSRE